jgi:hypothetical protein
MVQVSQRRERAYGMVLSMRGWKHSGELRTSAACMQGYYCPCDKRERERERRSSGRQQLARDADESASLDAFGQSALLRHIWGYFSISRSPIGHGRMGSL